MIRLEIDTAFACRPRKGERRAKDGSGRLVKCDIFYGDNLDEMLAEARKSRANSDRFCRPGYAEVIGIRAYDDAAFRINPLKATPFYSATSL